MHIVDKDFTKILRVCAKKVCAKKVCNILFFNFFLKKRPLFVYYEVLILWWRESHNVRDNKIYTYDMIHNYYSYL